MSDAVAALYHNFRAEEEVTRKTILAYLEEARWLEFDQLREARDFEECAAPSIGAPDGRRTNRGLRHVVLRRIS